MPSATASESEKNGMSRFAFSEPSIGSQTTRHGAPVPKTALAELLGDEREVLVEVLEPVHDRRLGRGVDRRRVVAADAGLEDGLALDPRRQLGEHGLDVADRTRGRRRATASSARRQTGWKSRPEISFGKKYVVFCGSTSPRRAWAKTSSIRVGSSR